MSKSIKLTKGQVALVDDDWYEMLSLVKWYANSGFGYRAATNIVRDKVIHKEYMHRVIMDAPKGGMRY